MYTPLRLTAVVPATNRPSTLAACRAAITAADSPPDELIVVDAPPLAGPAEARNRGVRQAHGDIVVFVDADVVVHRDVFVRIRKAFEEDAELAALFGSYDDTTVADDPVSAFRNLLHHAVHQDSAGEVITFWAGLGAVRRSTFLENGGFDDVRYPRPSIEDIDLGMRLTAGGARILLDPSIQGTHLKAWSLGAMLRTDLFDRAAPWVVLLLRHRTLPPTLNLGWRHRLSAAAVLFGVAGLVTRRRTLAAGSGAAFLALNASFYRLLARKRGHSQAASGVVLHAIHHLAGMAAVPLGLARFVSEELSRSGDGSPSPEQPVDEASKESHEDPRRSFRHR